MIVQFLGTLFLIGIGVAACYGAVHDKPKPMRAEHLSAGDRNLILIGFALLFLGIGNMVLISFGAYS